MPPRGTPFTPGFCYRVFYQGAAIARFALPVLNDDLPRDRRLPLPFSATEILQAPEGVCPDYAILFATLARAAGIPTRLCGGIVYFQFAQGDATDMFNAVRVVGQLKAEVLEYR
jgi:Transglutaminase-like superfamily